MSTRLTRLYIFAARNTFPCLMREYLEHRLSIIICRLDGESITISCKLSLSETIQVQEPRKAVYDLSKAITIWLSLNIRLAATGAWIHILLDFAHDGKFIYVR